MRRGHAGHDVFLASWRVMRIHMGMEERFQGETFCVPPRKKGRVGVTRAHRVGVSHPPCFFWRR